MLLIDMVETSALVAATRSRTAKVAALAACLAQAPESELRAVTAFLGGALLQRRTGLGWRGVSNLPSPAPVPELTVAEVNDTFERLAHLSGSGSAKERAGRVAALFARATGAEQEWLRGVVTGGVRQGALDALVQEALARATGIDLAVVRRAAMLAGGTVPIVEAAFTGGATALQEVHLEVGRPVLPMLASSAPGVAAAFAKLGVGPVILDTKLDGIRLQVHRSGDDVLVVTRSLDDITDRLPEVVRLARSLPSASFVLDGEALMLAADGRPSAFQDTAARTASGEAPEAAAAISAYFFDALHIDGVDLIDRPATERLAALDRLVPAAFRTPRLVTAEAAAGQDFFDEIVAAGHEGVVIKSPVAGYDAGRRGAAWVKVKPVHTLDLVVLAVEWGSGRRRGWLSNLHLGARDPASGEFVMLGKTFKGMTDEMLAWQTQRLQELQTSDDGWVVTVRPEQVVEIAFDGVQRSTRYPGGVALRFARVVRYRDDKTAAEADTIATLQDLLVPAPRA